jgi:tetratricopeptide (TPR) repeat protein
MISSLESYLASFSPQIAKQTTPQLDFERNFLILSTVVDKLYSIRSSYGNEPAIRTITLDEAVEKAARCSLILLNKLTKRQKMIHGDCLETNIIHISTHPFDPTLSSSQKSRYYYIRGKILNVFQYFIESAEVNLQKASKLDPTFIDAWIQLGESYYKKGDNESAMFCFQWGLEKVMIYLIFETNTCLLSCNGGHYTTKSYFIC